MSARARRRPARPHRHFGGCAGRVRSPRLMPWITTTTHGQPRRPTCTSSPSMRRWRTRRSGGRLLPHAALDRLNISRLWDVIAGPRHRRRRRQEPERRRRRVGARAEGGEGRARDAGGRVPRVWTDAALYRGRRGCAAAHRELALERRARAGIAQRCIPRVGWTLRARERGHGFACRRGGSPGGYAGRPSAIGTVRECCTPTPWWAAAIRR